MPHGFRSPHPARAFLVRAFALGAALAGALAGAAAAQVATVPTKIPPVEDMILLHTGTFEVWRDTTRIGTEFYRFYRTESGDSLVAASTVRYELRDDKGPFAYEKYTVTVIRSLDSYPLIFQSAESFGGRTRALSATTHDTTAVVMREGDGHGRGSTVALPVGRVYLLDPSVFEHVENLVRDFLSGSSQTRTFQAFIPPRDTVIHVRLTRGPVERFKTPSRGTAEGRRVDVYDDLTLVQVWMDANGEILKLSSPTQSLRVFRLPPGEAEAQAAANAKGGAASPAATSPAPPSGKP